MTDDEKKDSKTLTFKPKSDELRSELSGARSIRQNLNLGRSKNVSVEVRKKRGVTTKTSAFGDQSAQGTDLTQAEVAERLEAVKKSLQNRPEPKPVVAPPVVPTVASPVIADEAVVSESEPEAKSQTAAQTVRKELYKKDFKDKKFGETKEPEKKAFDHEKRKSKKLHVGNYADGETEEVEKRPRYGKKKKKSKAIFQPEKKAFIAREVVIPSTITVNELSNRMAVRASDVIKALISHGVIATVNDTIDGDIAQIICEEFKHISKRVSEDDVEKLLQHSVDDNPEEHIARAPVVTIMGHVDHGKTSLLDAIRKTSVVTGEAGGITQHIGAYRVETPSKKSIVFIDTPGHAAFSAMRARGAHVTDIVVLVVAADDGIKAQTIEAIGHAKAAEVPILVAINKMDKPDADPERVKNELLQHHLVAEAYGGDVIVVEVSAKTGANLDKLEEAILLQAEMLALKANPHCAAQGVVIESSIEKGRGPVTTILIQKGTLKMGDIVVAGTEYGKVKALMNDRGQNIKEASLSMPIQVVGFSGAPAAGEDAHVVSDEATANAIVMHRLHKAKNQNVVTKGVHTIDTLLQSVAGSDKKALSLLIKGDVHGSVEAIKQSIEKLSDEKVSLNVLHYAVGPINESDVALAKASKSMIVAFNVRANTKAREGAKQEGIEVRYYSIIYNIIDDVKAIMKGLTGPVFQDKFIGYAEIRQVFNISKLGSIAGCMVTEGMVRRGAKVRLLRSNIVIHEGTLKTLKRFKDEVKEAKEGYECGMAFEHYNDIKVGDVIECFVQEEVDA